MKNLVENEAISRLDKIRSEFRNEIVANYEHKAKSCLTCEVQGSCCLDEHFVNVHITRLEAAAMKEVLNELSDKKRTEILERILETVSRFKLDEALDSFAITYSCPLFEKGIGCLVHSVKPLACIQHACYERKEDLPPDELLETAEAKVDRLNQQTYKQNQWLPIPVWLAKILKN